MAKRKTNEEPIIEPSVDPKTGIKLVEKQIEKANELLSKKPDDWSNHSAWDNTTRDYLIKIFGSRSPNVNAVIHASSSVSSHIGMSPIQIEDYRRSLIENQIKMLKSCVEQLETQIELSETKYKEGISETEKDYDKTRRTPKGYAYVKNPPEQWIIAQGNHEPIIDREDFEKAQIKVNERRQARRKNRRSYPLSGILYCAKCNHKYLGQSAVSNHRTGAQKTWYRCSAPARSFIKCDNKSVKMEKQVLGLLFKNIKIARKDIFSFDFFSPFNSLYFEAQHKYYDSVRDSAPRAKFLNNSLQKEVKCRRQKTIPSLKSTLKLSAAR